MNCQRQVWKQNIVGNDYWDAFANRGTLNFSFKAWQSCAKINVINKKIKKMKEIWVNIFDNLYAVSNLGLQQCVDEYMTKNQLTIIILNYIYKVKRLSNVE